MGAIPFKALVGDLLMIEATAFFALASFWGIGASSSTDVGAGASRTGNTEACNYL
jgi:hypothetical protein